VVTPGSTEFVFRTGRLLNVSVVRFLSINLNFSSYLVIGGLELLYILCILSDT